MLGKLKRPFATLTRVVMLLLVSSCAATVAKPHLYLLTSMPAAQSSGSFEANTCAPVEVTVNLPAYLRRDGLVLQLNDNELVAADGHLWAEPLVYGVERVLNVCLNPSATGDPKGQGAARQVKVVVEQLHGNAEGVSNLQATWSELNASASQGFDLLSADRFSAQAQQREPGYAALVSVQRDLLLDLCQQITEQLAQCTR